MDFYEILGVNRNSTQEEIKKVYKKLVIKYHPDKNLGDKDSETKFKKITEAYNTLSNPELKQKYDIKLKFKNIGNLRNINIFENIFSSSNFNNIRRKAKPIYFTLICSISELYTGCNKKIKINRDIHGNLDEKILNIKIEPGYKHNTKISFPCEGNKPLNYLQGDLIFIIMESKDKIFKRNNNDIHYDLNISVSDAIFGFKKTIKYIDNSDLEISCKGITDSNKKLVYMTKGMPIRKNKMLYGYGDMIVNLIIIFTPNKYLLYSEDDINKMKELL